MTPPTWKQLLTSKALIVSFLTVVAMCAAHFGYSIDVAHLLAFVTPLMVAIGALGWGDVAQLKARLALEHAVKMHMIERGTITPFSVLNGDIPPHAPPSVAESRAQAGFARLGAILLLGAIVAAFAIAAFVTSGCGEVQTVETDTIDCLKAEGKTLTSGTDVAEIFFAVVEAFKSSDPQSAVLALGEHYGAEVVACVVDEYQPGAGSGSGAPSARVAGESVKQQSIAKLVPGKKLAHGKR